MNFWHRYLCLMGITTIFAMGSSSWACGPFFPETLLDQPRATLRPPIVNFEAEIRQLKPPSEPPEVAKRITELSKGGSYSYRSLENELLDPEVKELEEILSSLPEERRRRLVSDYRALRMAMLIKYWSENFESYGLTVPSGGYELFAQAQLGNWPAGLPEDIVLYLQGALLYNYGDKKGAVQTWERLLALPEDKRKNRSVAAAWMIAKVTREDDSLEAAQPWYEMCAKLSADGFRDGLKLGLASLGWEARYQLNQGNTRKALELYYHQAMAGDSRAWDSLLRALPDLEALSDEELVEWAKDPFLRGLLTAELLRDSFFWDPSWRDDTAQDYGVTRWLEAIEAANLGAVEEASKFGELAYSAGHFDLARRWLKQAPEADPRALWLRGKLALMAGDTKTAEKNLLAARAGFPRKQGSENGSIRMEGAASALSAETAMVYRTSQFYGDLGAANLARGHYPQALTSLYLGSFYEDAAYVAERVLSPEELLSYTRRNFPAPTSRPFGRQGEPTDDLANYKARYILARQLARHRLFKDARSFYPEELQPIFDRYVTLLRKARSGVPRDERAQAYWEAAQIHRVLGMELFGTEGEPDGGCAGGMFPATSYIHRRLGFTFAKIPFDYRFDEEPPPDIVPAPTSDERARVKQSKLIHEERFQYRYAAADLAWKAATLMPDKTNETARVLGIAGIWLQNRDPKAADRFYKAMIWRNWSTPLAREADKRRWFPQIDWEYDPWTATGIQKPDGF